MIKKKKCRFSLVKDSKDCLIKHPAFVQIEDILSMTELSFSLLCYSDIISEDDEQEVVILNSGFGKRTRKFGATCHDDDGLMQPLLTYNRIMAFFFLPV